MCCTHRNKLPAFRLKKWRVESGINKLKGKLRHNCICLHICLCTSKHVKHLLKPLTLTSHSGNLCGLRHDGALDKMLEIEPLWVHKSCSEYLASTIAFCIWELWATLALHPSLVFDPLTLSKEVEVQDLLVYISDTHFWKYCYDNSHKLNVVKCRINILWRISKSLKGLNCIKDKSTSQQSSYLPTSGKVEKI